MKIIDLLNKIAKGEEVPKKIKYDNYEWVYIDNEYANDRMRMTLFSDYIESNYCIIDCLNDEVEIIKEKEMDKCKSYDKFEGIDDYIEHLKDQIDNLIDVINDMRDKE